MTQQDDREDADRVGAVLDETVRPVFEELGGRLSRAGIETSLTINGEAPTFGLSLACEVVASGADPSEDARETIPVSLTYERSQGEYPTIAIVAVRGVVGSGRVEITEVTYGEVTADDVRARFLALLEDAAMDRRRQPRT